jgi:hypothetical protein
MENEEYKEKYSQRIGMIEPVFANIGYCKGLNRFTLRGEEKVNGQRRLYCIVHNLGKCLNALNESRKCAQKGAVEVNRKATEGYTVARITIRRSCY